jgi:hypothetical protein
MSLVPLFLLAAMVIIGGLIQLCFSWVDEKVTTLKTVVLVSYFIFVSFLVFTGMVFWFKVLTS